MRKNRKDVTVSNRMLPTGDVNTKASDISFPVWYAISNL